MGKRMDRIIGAVLFLLSLFTYFWVIPNYVDKPQLEMDELPADLYPKIIVGAMTILGFVLFLQGTMSRAAAKIATMPLENKKRAAIIVLSMIGYLFAIDIIGYYLATTAFLILTIMFLEERRVWVISASVIGFLLFNYLFFEQGLKLTLPRGLLINLLS